MMKIDRAEIAAAVLPGAVLAALLAAVGGVLAATLSTTERSALWALIEPRFALVFMLWLVAAIAAGTACRRAWQRFGAAPGRLAEDLQVLLSTDTRRELKAEEGSAGSRALAVAVNALVQQRDALRSDMAAQVSEASREVEQERNRLAALMAELTQSVVVCNLDGRVLLFNARARLQFRALAAVDKGSAAPDKAIGGAEAQGLGLGRSIYGVLDRRLVAHALEAVQQRLQRGAAHPAAQFVTATPGGQLLRVHLAPVRATSEGPPAAVAADAPLPEEPLNGFVLMLDNITRDLADDTERDRLLHSVTEGHRGSLGNLQAAVELLDEPELDAATRERFHAVIRDEIGAMSRRLNQAAEQGLRSIKARWPLEDMLGADFVAAAARRIAAQLQARVTTGEVDAQLWLKVDSFSLIQALQHLAGRLVQEYGVQRLQLRLAVSQDRAQLDLVWPAMAMSTESLSAWETEPMQSGDATTSLTVRDVVERHGGAFWFERARVRQEAFFRFLLPLAVEAAPLEAAALMRHDSRPEFYDFDLFRSAAAGGAGAAWVDMPLADLSYTVFDTETTGLEPSAGDQIIQIGATRIVAGKLRRQESFEQLVDPQRSVPAAGVAIHGIQPEQLQGQPTIHTVLPAFHAFAQDTVLVAHNAAFDMRFLQLQEAGTGVKFEQPVLDTLLLSAVIHPQQASHRLEAIAERLAVPVLGRHTALGDAMVTAEVFLKMVPLLQAQGITTLGQALEASRRTYLARVSY
jgi:DNA polymerase-3 subunit epsilon